VTAASRPARIQALRTARWRLGIPVALTLSFALSSCGEDPLLFSEPADLEPLAALQQEGTVGEAARELPRVRVVDTRGNPVPGARVRFQVEAGGGSTPGSSTLSDERGIADPGEWTLGPEAGEQRLGISLEGGPVQRFRVSAHPGPPAILTAARGQGAVGTVGSNLLILPQLAVSDQFGNPTPDVPVQFEVSLGDGQVEGGSTTTDVAGRAAPSRWTLGPTAGPQELEAHVGDLEPLVFQVEGRPAAPDTVEVVPFEVGERAVGDTLPPFEVEVRDRFGNRVGGAQLELLVLAGGGAASAPGSGTDEEGRGLVEWTLGPSAGSQRLRVGSGNARPAVVEVLARPGPAAALLPIDGRNQVAPAGEPVPVPPVVRVVDSFQNPVEGTAVTFHVLEGGGSLQGQSTVSDEAGEARLGQWRLGPDPGLNRLEARSPELEPVEFQAEGSEAELRTLEVVQGQNQQAAVGFQVADPPGVRLTTQEGSPVPGETVTFSVIEGGGSVIPEQVTTDTQGRAMLDSWTLGGEPGWNRIQVSAPQAANVTVSALALEGLQVEVEEVHVNQGSQSYPAQIPLLEGRGGLLRVFLRANMTNDETPPVQVIFYSGSSEISTQTVLAPSSQVPVDIDPDLATHSWDIPIPGSLVGPDLGIRVRVDENEEMEVVDRAALSWPADGSIHRWDVRAAPPFRATFVRIYSSDLDTTADLNEDNLDDYMRATLDFFPIGEHHARIRPGTYVSEAAPLSGSNQSDGWVDLVREMWELRLLDGEDDPAALERYYHGILNRGTSGSGIAGIAYVATDPNSSALAAVSHDAQGTRSLVVAHEFGHNFGRWHAPCNVSEGPDWPSDPAYDNARIATTGYLARTGSLIAASGNHRDLMSYCTPYWISDHTFSRVLDMRQARPVGAPLLPWSGPTDGILVSGQWSRQRGAELQPVLHLRGRAPEHGPGDAELRGTAADGSVIFSQAVDGLPLDHVDDPTLRHFVRFVPLAQEDRERLARIELLTPEGDTHLEAGAVPEGAYVEPGARPDPGLEVTPIPTPPGAPPAAGFGGWLQVRWNQEVYPRVVLRDEESGRVISIASSGDLRIPAPESGRLSVDLSDGLGQITERVELR
jgi:hypothetical protein